MESNRIPKIGLNAKLDGKREVGRPKLRWVYDFQTDLKVTGIKGWIRKVQNRLEWMDVIRWAEVKLRGCEGIEDEEEEGEVKTTMVIITPLK
jgi:hypothetical protein